VDRLTPAERLRRLADDLDFYASTADGSPEMVRAVGVELAALAGGLLREGRDPLTSAPPTEDDR
jgi:hypothetical protein